MDQLKDILKQMIKYRFWIAVGLSALLPLIAFFVGVGKIKQEATTKKTEIEGADKGVQEYASGIKPNQQWSTIVKGKTEVLTADVNTAWKKLYDRQGPLLQWPKEPPEVEQKFRKWGKEWPKEEDPAAVQLVIDKYILVYQDEVKKVYELCRPFKPEDGSGVVLAPTVEGLLQPSFFDPNNPPSDLGKIWSAQEKLWVQGALLTVIDKVNKNAKDWPSATIKQINDLQVANGMALDQISIAENVTLQDAKSITRGGEAGAPAAAAAAATPGEGTPGAAMPGMPGMGGFGGTADSATVSYLSSSTNQYMVVPVSLSVLIDQNSINNLLIELANSPMAIQVIDYEQTRPQARVTKPEKGQSLTGGIAGGAGMGGAGMMTSGRMAMMMRGQEGMFNAQMGGGGRSDYRGMMRGMSGMEPGAAGNGGYSSMMPGGYGPMGGGAAERKKGTDVRSRDMAKEQEARKKTREEAKVAVKIHDPYYNILEVRIYGQARFYNTPPAEQPAETTSAGETAAAEGAETPAAKPAEGQAAPAAGEPAKAGAEPPDESAAPAKTESEKPQADAPKDDAPKAEPAKADAPKNDAPKAEPAKADAPKAEAPKNDAPKTDAPKTDAPKAEPAKPAAGQPQH
jgi:hypothetical protein